MSYLELTNGEPFTNEEIAAFDNKALTACRNLAEMVKQKKEIEEKEKSFKAQLEKLMDEYGIKTMSNEYIRFTRIAANPGKATIDLDALKKNENALYMDLLSDYPKITGAKKAYVKFEVM